MPIIKTSSGLILLEECDSLIGWAIQKDEYPPSTANESLSTTRVSGSASFRTYDTCESMYGVGSASAYKTLDLGAGTNRRMHVQHYVGPVAGPAINWGAVSIAIINSSWIRLQTTPSCHAIHGWQDEAMTLLDSLTGDQIVDLNFAVLYSNGPGATLQTLTDHLIVCKSDDVTITSLAPGQKVELYRASDDHLIGSGTVAVGQTSTTVSVNGELFPELIYAKIYGTDGTSLWETTSSVTICGGDSWKWVGNTSGLYLSATSSVIYRSAAVGMPKSVTITATLVKPDGSGYAGKSLTLSTSLGSLTVTSGTTDSNGQLTTVLTSDVMGIAIVKGVWAGDVTVPAADAYVTVYVFQEAEAGDSSQPFQFYCMGIQYSHSSGKYGRNGEGIIEPFEAELRVWDDTITPNGLVSIYRQGIKEYAGILKKTGRALNGYVTVSGVDASGLLSDRNVGYALFPLLDPQDILTMLVSCYSCGVSIGLLLAYGSGIVALVNNELLKAGLDRICGWIGWVFRINLDLSIDFGASFTGVTTNLVFSEGVELLSVDVTYDLTSVETIVRILGGTGTTPSLKADFASMTDVGLHEYPDFQTTITGQALLDVACQAELDANKTVAEYLVIEAVDKYGTGSYSPEDLVTVTSPSLGLSGYYTVKRFERDLTDPNYAKIELQTRLPHLWELDENWKRMTKDVS